ncbi:uncharacterized protein H6S33_011002 [Morchella sextelata]|uniref:uncharacterized protein n=1 Tax=Morchella sextelata TaxID=1174677 RepID=UPI001D039C7D|nr:uncharacterized protein H6S33_011002 [Morchella sextelata]KAH0611737.1 hypothetical protein H6S33_011002 [Morchella sextelata]
MQSSERDLSSGARHTKSGKQTHTNFSPIPQPGVVPRLRKSHRDNNTVYKGSGVPPFCCFPRGESRYMADMQGRARVQVPKG